MFRVGELESLEHTNEFFVWALGLQLDKKLNSRELTKKINKYALLRTSDASKNLVLLSLIMGQEPYANDHIYINSVIKKINTYLCPDKEDFMRKHNLRAFGNRGIEGISESEWFQLILNYNLNIKDTFINQLLTGYEKAKSSTEPEFHLSSILRKVSIYEFDHSNNFISNWQSYISRGL